PIGRGLLFLEILVTACVYMPLFACSAGRYSIKLIYLAIAIRYCYLIPGRVTIIVIISVLIVRISIAIGIIIYQLNTRFCLIFVWYAIIIIIGNFHIIQLKAENKRRIRRYICPCKVIIPQCRRKEHYP